MKKSEELLKLAEANNIEIIDVFVDDEKLEGLYADNTVLINTIVKETKYNEVLGHELGHHFTLEGNNLLKKQGNDLQEFCADAWSYKNIIPLKKLIEYKLWDYEEWEILESENITHEFLSNVFLYYKDKYGYEDVKVDGYVANFYPEFTVKVIY